MSFVNHAFLSTVLVIAIFASDPLKAVSYEDATEGQFKFQVSIQKNGVHLCGGAIYSKDRIVTASQCCSLLDASQRIEIVAGNLHLVKNMAESLSTTQQRNISTILRHGKGNETGLDAGICVLELEKSLDLNGINVDAIELERDEELPSESYTCQVVGWGTSQKYNARRVLGSHSTFSLMFANVSLLNSERCRKEFGQLFQEQNMTCSETGMAPDQDNWSQGCVTDDGGPLICNGKLYGVLSFVGGCTAKESSSFLTVSKFSDWLDNMNQPPFRDNSLRHHISFFIVTCIIPLLLGKILNE